MPSTSAALYCLFVALTLLLSRSRTTAQEVEDEREFSYDPERENGPGRWGEIHAEWGFCGNGTMQSPIDLHSDRVRVVSHLGRLKRKYKPANATIVNRGHDMMLRWEDDAGEILLNGSRYKLRQCHWHSPSEHTLDGRRFALELHMVHENPQNGALAIVGIMYTVGRRDSFLSRLKKHLKAVSGSGDVECAVGTVSPKEVQLGSRKYYRYLGSLTTPPCTEGVTWTVIRKVRTASREQMKLLRDAVHDNAEENARPRQPLNKRGIHLYRPTVPRPN